MSLSNSSRWLYEYDTGNRFGPASEEETQQYKLAVAAGKAFFLRGYHGYHLKMVVKES